MRLLSLFTVVMIQFLSVAFAADFQVPTVSRCMDDMSNTNQRDPNAYRIFSDFYYEYQDKRRYAVRAIEETVQQYSAASSSCQTFTQPMNTSTVKCYQVAGSDVCTVPSDAGEWVVVKDYVDSTNVILTSYGRSHADVAGVKSKHDFETLWMPQPELCYGDLLGNYNDSQSHLVDFDRYSHYSDLRFIMARASRELVASLSVESPECTSTQSGYSTLNMQCIVRPNKPKICGFSKTGGGYFVYVTDADNKVHVVFNRWD